MIWREIFLKKDISRLCLNNALKKVFSIENKNICIVSSISNIEYDIADEIKILCETSKVNAEFFLKISIYLRDSFLIPEKDINKLGELCEALEMEILVDDEDINPSAMIIISKNNSIKKLYINIEEYEDLNEFELS